MASRKVVVRFGQSNQEGRGIATSLPASLTGPQANTSVWNRISGNIETLDVSTGNNMSFPPVGIGLHGPEMSACAAAVAELGEIHCYKYAIDGTSLNPGSASIWHPNKLPVGNNLFEFFKTDWANFVAALALSGDTPDVIYVSWLQGESDAIFNGIDTSYLGTFKYFISKVREFLADYSTSAIIPWVTHIIHRGIVPDGFTYLDDRVRNVRGAQFRAGWSDPYYRIVDNERFSHSGDNLHLDSAGAVEAGTAEWAAYKLDYNNS